MEDGAELPVLIINNQSKIVGGCWMFFSKIIVLKSKIMNSLYTIINTQSKIVSPICGNIRWKVIFAIA
jgi:hypothetical protein